MGGEHFAAWLDCGVYDAPVPDEVAVHDLEHGAVWITYDADALDAEQVAALEDALPEQRHHVAVRRPATRRWS